MQVDPNGQPKQASVSNKSKAIHRWVAKWSRWLHIYLSMLSLGAIFFFSITGLTLNHPDWFFRETTTSKTGRMDANWLNRKTPPPTNWNESDLGHEIEKLLVVEHLRNEHKLAGRVSDFLAFSDECEVTFQGPGYAATARIVRATGDYELSVTCNDLVSILNDLHKGRHTGPLWSIVIDVSAIVSGLVALSGMVLVFYLRLNRKTRLAISVIGILLVLLFVRIAWHG
jgi:uncharacterized protein